MQPIKNNKGVTLVEMVVVLLLAVMLMAVAYIMMNTGFKSFQSTSDRVDVQSQFRLVVDILEEEIGYAKNVTIQHYDSSDDIPAPGSKFNYLYIKPVGNGMFSLCKKDELGEHVYETPYPLKDFDIRFQMDPSVVEANILTVWLDAEGADTFVKGILTQNTNITSVPSTSGYNTVYYEEY